MVRTLTCVAAATAAFSSLGASLAAQSLPITEAVPSVTIQLGSRNISIKRNANPEARIPDAFAKTSRACPPFCVQPMSPVRGVETVAELEVLEFLETDVQNGTGLLIDARLPEWFSKGALPGAINLPFTAIDPNNDYLVDILASLGADKTGAGWDFSEAYSLLIYGNGPWSDQSSRAVQSFVAAGYPPHKIKYYRAGLQGWLQLGFNLHK